MNVEKWGVLRRHASFFSSSLLNVEKWGVRNVLYVSQYVTVYPVLIYRISDEVLYLNKLQFMATEYPYFNGLLNLMDTLPPSIRENIIPREKKE